MESQIDAVVRDLCHHPISAMLRVRGEEKFLLNEVLQDPVLFVFFKRVAAINFDAESVLCFEEVERLKRLSGNEGELAAALIKLVDTFVTGDMELNISGGLKARMLAMRSTPNDETFQLVLADLLVELHRMMQIAVIGSHNE